MTRFTLLAFAVVGCSHPSSHPPAPDAPSVPNDVASRICSAPAGTASVLAVVDGLSTTFGRLDAGGVWNVGPVNGATSAPMTLTLLLTNDDPLSDQEAACCQGHDTTCCTIDGLTITSDLLLSGAELGNHSVHIERFLDRAFTLTGTLDITTFEQPFEHAPGRIAGSVSAVDGLRSVSGTVDNTFCAALLTATI